MISPLKLAQSDPIGTKCEMNMPVISDVHLWPSAESAAPPLVLLDHFLIAPLIQRLANKQAMPINRN